MELKNNLFENSKKSTNLLDLESRIKSMKENEESLKKELMS